MSVRSLFSIVAVAFVLSTMVAGADAAKTGKNARQLQPKAPKATKTPKAPKAPKGGYKSRRMLDTGDRRLSLKYMTDRFNEEGSVRSFVDSLGFEVDLYSGRGEKEGVLSKEDCESLMSLLDIGPHVEEGDAFDDFQKHIDETELVSVIGKVRNEATVVHVRNGHVSSALSTSNLI